MDKCHCNCITFLKLGRDTELLVVIVAIRINDIGVPGGLVG